MHSSRERSLTPDGAFHSRKRPPWRGFLPNKTAQRILGMIQDDPPGPHRIILSVEHDDLLQNTEIRERFAHEFRFLQKARLLFRFLV